MAHRARSRIEKPILGITLGDPAGVGPEIAVKALARQSLTNRFIPVVLGDASIIARAEKICARRVRLAILHDYPAPGKIEANGFVLDLGIARPKQVLPGTLSRLAGEAAYAYLVKAIELAMDGRLDAIVTAPLNKQALNLAGHHYAGHTEILAEKTGTRDYRMMLVSGKLRIVHVTCHVSLAEAVRMVRRERVRETIMLTLRVLPLMGVARPRVAVAGLNPHAGESGLFGEEEKKEIIPAVAHFRRLGLDVSGPHPPDTVFMRAARGEFDCVVAMYHDQGHIAVKATGFETAVNVTVGIPIVRTSVAHGTAFDIAGKGTADEGSLVEAIRLAALMAANRHARGQRLDKQWRHV